jgi:four helix bundle protein
MATTFQDLRVWQKAHEVVLDIYRLTAAFPREELFGLTAQVRRAAVSVPANIAEGFVKRGKSDKVRFYNIAQGSLEEVRYYLILSATWISLSQTPCWKRSMKSAGCSKPTPAPLPAREFDCLRSCSGFWLPASGFTPTLDCFAKMR